MSAVFFFIAAIGVLAGAVGVIALRDPFYSVLALVVHLIFLAALFLLLRAQFVAAVQVVVYAGAVMVLYVFVVAYVGGADEEASGRLRSPAGVTAPVRIGALILGAALATELLIALLGTGLKAIDSGGAPIALHGHLAYGTPAYIGNLLLTRFLLVFEIASFLLLVAAVGAIMLAGRYGARPRRSGEQPHVMALHEPRPQGTGTMGEGVGTRAVLEGIARASEAELSPAEKESERDPQVGAGAGVGAKGNEEGLA